MKRDADIKGYQNENNESDSEIEEIQNTQGSAQVSDSEDKK